MWAGSTLHFSNLNHSFSTLLIVFRHYMMKITFNIIDSVEIIPLDLVLDLALGSSIFRGH